MTIDLVLTGRDAHRVMISGQTRSGKSTVAIALANAATRAVWFDVKGENDPHWPVVPASVFLDAPADQRAAVLAQQFAYAPRIVVQLASRPGVDDAAQVDAAAQAVFDLRDTLFVLDDAMGVLESRAPYFVRRLVTMGASRGCGFMAVSQRVHSIPLLFLSEASHLLAFVAYDDDDVSRLVLHGGPGFETVRTLAPREYLWCDRTKVPRTVHRFKPLRRVA